MSGIGHTPSKITGEYIIYIREEGHGEIHPSSLFYN
jgi:hypothetical protein